MSNSEALDASVDGRDMSFKVNKTFYFSCFVLLSLWVVFCWKGLSTVIQIWYVNEIFNHGFFIVPGAFYLIYLKRRVLFTQPIKPAPLAFIFIIPTLFLYVIGIVGDVQLFLHAATFALLPLLMWLVLGTQAARTILFPLIFMLFSVPVGEQLVPYLQEIAADGAVALLRLTDVPLFRSGLYIEIPQGRFLVAEACSGVSFFIASFVIGSLYAYLNLVTKTRRALFVATSLIFPILANIVRVYGIILIAYWTDMEHAAGADHLIYGWFFFAFVIVCLLGIGELMREEKTQLEEGLPSINKKVQVSLFVVSTCCALMIVFFGLYNLIQVQNKDREHVMVNLSALSDGSCNQFGKFAVLNNPTLEKQVALKNSNCNSSILVAYFNEENNELASYLNRDFDPSKYSLEESFSLPLKQYSVSVSNVVSPSGEKLTIYKWYVVDSRVYSTQERLKLQQIINKLLFRPHRGEIWLFATANSDSFAAKKLPSLIEYSVNRKLTKQGSSELVSWE